MTGPKLADDRQPDPWERVAPSTYRMPVPGGWLYRYGWQSTDTQAIAFIPEPKS